MSLVVFDSETGGLTLADPTIQLAAVALGPDLTELEAFNVRIQFDESNVDPQALAMNHYDADLWKREAIPERNALDDFAMFLKRHASVEMISKAKGTPYYVARLAGYNAADFDGPRLKNHFQQHSLFLAAHPRVLCVLQRAQWWFQEHPEAKPPADMKLGTVCHHFGIPVGDAHDALVDCRLTVRLMRALRRSRLDVELAGEEDAVLTARKSKGESDGR